MNEQVMHHRIDVLENQVRELHRKQDEDHKWKYVVQKWMSENFDFSVHKQLQRQDFLNFNNEPPSACQLLGKNIQTAPQLHSLFRKQQEEFGRALQYINMNNMNFSNSNINMSSNSNSTGGLGPGPGPGPGSGPGPGPGPGPILGHPHLNQRFPSPSQNQNANRSQDRRKSFDVPPNAKRSYPMPTMAFVPPPEPLYHPTTFPGHIPVPTCIVPAPNSSLISGNHGLGPGRFPSSISNSASRPPQPFAPCPCPCPGLGPGPRLVQGQGQGSSQGPGQDSSHMSQQQPPFSTLGPSRRGSSPEVEVIAMNRPGYQTFPSQSPSQGNPLPRHHSHTTLSGPGSNNSNSNSNASINSSSNLSPAHSSSASTTSNLHQTYRGENEMRANEPPDFSNFIKDLSRMCEPSNSNQNPNQNPNPNLNPNNSNLVSNTNPSFEHPLPGDPYRCNQCHLIFPNRQVADMHFEAIHCLPTQSPYSAYQNQHHNNYPQARNPNYPQRPPGPGPGPFPVPDMGPGLGPGPGPLTGPVRPRSSSKSKADQLQKRNSSNSISTSGLNYPNAPFPDQSQAQLLNNMPPSIPVFQPQMPEQSVQENPNDSDNSSFIKIVSIHSAGKRYVPREHALLSQNQSQNNLILPPLTAERHYRRKRKKIVLDEITLSDDEDESGTVEDQNQNRIDLGNVNQVVSSNEPQSQTSPLPQPVPSETQSQSQSPRSIADTYTSILSDSRTLTSPTSSLRPRPRPVSALSIDSGISGSILPLSSTPPSSKSSSTSSEQHNQPNLNQPSCSNLSPVFPLASVESEPIIVVPEINLYTSNLELDESSSNSNFNSNNSVEADLNNCNRIADGNVNVSSSVPSPPLPRIQIRNFDSYPHSSGSSCSNLNDLNIDMQLGGGGGGGNGQQDCDSILPTNAESASSYLSVMDSDEVEQVIDFKPCVNIL